MTTSENLMSSLDSSGYDTQAFDRGAAPVLRLFSADQARQFVQFQGDDQLRQRIDELAEKSSEGTLTAAERAEYHGYVVRGDPSGASTEAVSATPGMISAATRR